MVSAFELGQTTQPLEQVKYMTPGAMEQEGLENIKLPWSSVVLPAIWDNTETSGDILKGVLTYDTTSKDDKKIEAVKSYVYMKVKLLFDPPASSSVMEAMNRAINEFEWRLTLASNK